jgi:hypothetical protein
MLKPIALLGLLVLPLVAGAEGTAGPKVSSPATRVSSFKLFKNGTIRHADSDGVQFLRTSGSPGQPKTAINITQGRGADGRFTTAKVAKTTQLSNGGFFTETSQKGRVLSREMIASLSNGASIKVRETPGGILNITKVKPQGETRIEHSVNIRTP